MADQTLTTPELRIAKPDRVAFLAVPRRPIRVVLDGVQQSYNVGAIFRLCDAMLVDRLIICGKSMETGMRKLIQAARGTQHWVPHEICEDAVAAGLACRNDGYRIVVAEQTRDAVPPQLLPAVFPVCLVLGSEFHGVSNAVLALADAAVAIPVHGMANSLNVSTAAAIILNHLTLAWSQQAEQSQ